MLIVCDWFSNTRGPLRSAGGLSETLSETSSKTPKPLRTFQTCCPYSCCPLIFRRIDYQNRGQKLNPNIFFSNFSGASGISEQNPGISRQKSLIPCVSRDIPNFLAPTLSRGSHPPHQKISGLKSLGLGSFFVPDKMLR